MCSVLATRLYTRVQSPTLNNIILQLKKNHLRNTEDSGRVDAWVVDHILPRKAQKGAAGYRIVSEWVSE